MSEPRFRDLPVHPDNGLRHSWDVWPADDVLGTINRITDASVRDAVLQVRSGRRYNLALPLDQPDPPIAPRRSYRHHVEALAHGVYDDYLDGFYLQSSSQWDSLLHLRAGRAGFYKGRQGDPAEQVAAGGAGLEAWAEHGIVARGVLLDLAGYLEERGTIVRAGEARAFEPDLLAAVAAAQGVSFNTADILLIRTGWLKSYLAAGPAEREELSAGDPAPGLQASEAMAEYLWDTGCAAIVADNPAIECSPGDPAIGWLHRRLLPMLGFALGELWNLEELAAASRADGRYTSCVVAAPLTVPGAIGSPANAMAIR